METPSVVTLMLPTQNPAWLISVEPGFPSSVCRTNAAGAVTHAVDCAPSTCSTTSMRGRSQPALSPLPTPMIATAGLAMLKYVGFVLLSLPWWLTWSRSMPPALMSGFAPPGEIAVITEVSTSSCAVERPVHESEPPPRSLAHR